MAFNAFREGATNPSNDFQPQFTTEPTGPGEDIMCQNKLKRPATLAALADGHNDNFLR